MKKSPALFVPICLLTGLLFCSGCNIAGLLASPTWQQQKTTAEYKLAEASSDGILVFVDTPRAADIEPDLQWKLTDRLIRYLKDKAGISAGNIVPSEKIRQLQTRRSDFYRIPPAQLAQTLDARLVLYVKIEQFDFYRIADSRYYQGTLITRSILFDGTDNRILWPDDKGRLTRIKIDIETKGRDIAIERLISATAHCITRSFYNCPRDTYRADGEAGSIDLDSPAWPAIEDQQTD